MTLPPWVKGTSLLAFAVAGGIAIGASYERNRISAHHSTGMDSHAVLDHFTSELDLDSAQRQAIGAILARRQALVDSAWHAVQPHMRQAMHLTLNEIAGVLRPDQLAKYQKMMNGRHPEALR